MKDSRMQAVKNYANGTKDTEVNQWPLPVVETPVRFDLASHCRQRSPINTTGDEEMKKVVENVAGEGLKKLLGERVTLFCAIYIYTGKLVGVNDSCVLLEDAGIVYETGGLTDKGWKDMQRLPGPWYVQTAMIESFGILK